MLFAYIYLSLIMLVAGVVSNFKLIWSFIRSHKKILFIPFAVICVSILALAFVLEPYNLKICVLFAVYFICVYIIGILAAWLWREKLGFVSIVVAITFFVVSFWVIFTPSQHTFPFKGYSSIEAMENELSKKFLFPTYIPSEINLNKNPDITLSLNGLYINKRFSFIQPSDGITNLKGYYNFIENKNFYMENLTTDKSQCSLTMNVQPVSEHPYSYSPDNANLLIANCQIEITKGKANEENSYFSTSVFDKEEYRYAISLKYLFMNPDYEDEIIEKALWEVTRIVESMFIDSDV